MEAPALRKINQLIIYVPYYEGGGFLIRAQGCVVAMFLRDLKQTYFSLEYSSYSSCWLPLEAGCWAIFKMMGPNHFEKKLKNSLGLIQFAVRALGLRLCVVKATYPGMVFKPLPCLLDQNKNNSKFDCLADFQDLGYSGIYEKGAKHTEGTYSQNV